MDDEKFYAWAKENPRTIDLFLQYARDARAAGRRHYGIRAITERVRWHVAIQTRGDDFKINNNWNALLARLLVRIDPTLDGLFELRRRGRRAVQLPFTDPGPVRM